MSFLFIKKNIVALFFYHSVMLNLLSLQPEEPIKEDFLFPMSHRLSYASSPESDYEGYGRPHSMYNDDGMEGGGGGREPPPRLMRSSSDPSLTVQDNVPGIPPYPAPPSYNRGYYPVCKFYSETILK